MPGKFFRGFLCALQRRDIVTGMVEPTDEECEWTSDREEEDALAVSAGLMFSLSKWVTNQDRCDGYSGRTGTVTGLAWLN